MLDEKIKALKRMYRHLDRHTSAFKRRSDLACVNGCGACCMNGALHSTILEFIPAAHDLYLKGEYDTILEQIENKQDSICVFYNPFSKGQNCTIYRYRGLICRLYGFSVKYDKNGKGTLVTCQQIKNATTSTQIRQFLDIAPNLSSYYLRLYGIDPALSVVYLPVNQAIKEAIEQVLLYFNYRIKPVYLIESPPA